MKNKLTDLNNHLFMQLERLNDEDIKDVQLEEEIMRANAISNIAKQIIDNGKLVLAAKKYVTDTTGSTATVPKMLEE